MRSTKLKSHVDWFHINRNRYEALCAVAAATSKALVLASGIDILDVTHRAKTLESFEAKLRKKPYKDPRKEMTDLAGIRVITFIDSDVLKVASIIKDNFNVHSEHSGDKSAELGSDRFGYRSVHIVCDLGAARTALPELSSHKSLLFEVQIRTALQHAWAEIEHDRSYKFNGELPSKLKRRFYLIAGLLELADREFDSLTSEISDYSTEVHAEAESGNFDIEINSASITEYLKVKLTPLIATHKFEPQSIDKDLIDELKSFGILTLKDMDNICTPVLLKTIIDSNQSSTTYGLLRDVMILTDIEKYFKICWKENWQGWDVRALKLAEDKYGEDEVASIVANFGIDVYSEEDVDGLIS